MRFLFPCVSFLLLLLTSCSEFNQALKSTDPKYKLDVVSRYFAAAEVQLPDSASKKERRKQRHKASSNYERCLPLLEELTALTRGDTVYERVCYMRAKSYYGIKDHIMAGYYLEHFSKTFTASRFAEECAFLSAMCQYRESPAHELDQSSTLGAINQFQVFLGSYPNTALKDSCNNLIDRLRAKLETKDHENAMLYVKTRNYEPADIALRNFLRKWPNSSHRESVLFNILLMDHDLAVNSVPMRKPARVDQALVSHQTFLDAFPQSTQVPEADRLKEDLLSKQERFLFEALSASHAMIADRSGPARASNAEVGLRFFDTFAARFPESRLLPDAQRMRDDLLQSKQTTDSPKAP